MQKRATRNWRFIVFRSPTRCWHYHDNGTSLPARSALHGTFVIARRESTGVPIKGGPEVPRSGFWLMVEFYLGTLPQQPRAFRVCSGGESCGEIWWIRIKLSRGAVTNWQMGNFPSHPYFVSFLQFLHCFFLPSVPLLSILPLIQGRQRRGGWRGYIPQ